MKGTRTSFFNLLSILTRLCAFIIIFIGTRRHWPLLVLGGFFFATLPSSFVRPWLRCDNVLNRTHHTEAHEVLLAMWICFDFSWALHTRIAVCCQSFASFIDRMFRMLREFLVCEAAVLTSAIPPVLSFKDSTKSANSQRNERLVCSFRTMVEQPFYAARGLHLDPYFPLRPACKWWWIILQIWPLPKANDFASTLH